MFFRLGPFGNFAEYSFITFRVAITQPVWVSLRTLAIREGIYTFFGKNLNNNNN